MTVRQVYEYSLIEVNKAEAPSLLLDDFIYLLNKSITDEVNMAYNSYEENQQLTDHLRVLTGNAVLTNLSLKPNSVFKATYAGSLPQDYLHILNCTAEFALTSGVRVCCPLKHSDAYKGVRKMTSQMYSGIIDNYYQKPSQRTPYFYIRNTIEPVIDTNGIRVRGDRDGNASAVNIEIIYGQDNDKFALNQISVDYLKVPKYVTLTEEEIEDTVDNSQVMEFPNYVCLEIIKRLVALMMENASDQRLQTNIPINQSIAPAQSMQARK